MAVGAEAGHQMDQEVERTAMAGMLDLADVLELVVDRLDERPLAQEQLVAQVHEDVAHVLAPLGDEPHSVLEEELFGQWLGDVALVADELAEQPPDEARDRLAVVHVTGRQAEGEQFAALVDDQMELEAVEPADRGLTPTRVHRKDAVLVNAGVVADGQSGGVHKAKLMPVQAPSCVCR